MHLYLPPVDGGIVSATNCQRSGSGSLERVLPDSYHSSRLQNAGATRIDRVPASLPS